MKHLLVLFFLLASGASALAEPVRACKTPDEVEALRGAVFDAWNDRRAAAGLRALSRSATLDKVAQAQSCINAERNTMLHVGRDGADLVKRVKRAGYRFRSVNENVGKFRSASNAVNWWMGSEGHRENILSPRMRQLGVGIAMAQDGRLHWTGVSGRPR